MSFAATHRFMTRLCTNQDLETYLSGQTQCSITLLWFLQYNGLLTLR